MMPQTPSRSPNLPASNDFQKPMKYILVTGGVISGVGKGIISSSIGVLLKNTGYKVTSIKIDPYLNVDAGTFSPYEHGEVFVLDDGGEVDLDLGNYERFLNIRLTKDNNITTGKIYQQLMEKERRGDYMGHTVQMIPHVTDFISEWIERVALLPVDGSTDRPDVCIIELGGTIGDIEGMPFTHAFERYQGPRMKENFMNVHVSLLICPDATGEPKTKQMQNSVKQLRMAGIEPDLVVCRSEKPLTHDLRKKISLFSIVEEEQVINVHDVSNVYKVPLILQEQGVLKAIQERLGLSLIPPDVFCRLRFTMVHWAHLSELVESFSATVTIGLVGKYVKIPDAYASVRKALDHAAVFVNRKLVIKYINSEYLEEPRTDAETTAHFDAWKELKQCQGIVVPGGFDFRGVEGKISCCRHAREYNIPFLGICLGMQAASIEFARNVLNIEGANSTEFKKDLSPLQQIVIDMPEHQVSTQGLGGSMRLGRRSTLFLTEDSKLRGLYKQELVEERHRHRYEVNPLLVPELSKHGLLFVGMGVDENNTDDVKARRTEGGNALVEMAENQDGDLLTKISNLCTRGEDTKTPIRMEILELKDHPYYVGVQYHPEYLSAPLAPSPPFFGLLLAATGQLESYLNGDKVPTPMAALCPHD